MARQTGTVGMGRVDVSGLSTLADPMMKGLQLQQQSDDRRLGNYRQSLLDTAKTIDSQRQHMLQLEANERAKEKFLMEKDAVERSNRGEQALADYTQQLGALSENVVPSNIGSNIGLAYQTNIAKGMTPEAASTIAQRDVNAAQMAYNKDVNQQRNVLSTVATPSGEYDRKPLLDARRNVLTDITTADRDKKTDEYRNKTYEESVRAHKAGESYNRAQLGLLQQKYNDEVSAEKAVGEALTIPKTVSYFETPQGSLLLENANKALDTYSTTLNNTNATDAQKKQAQFSIDSITRQVLVNDKQVLDPNYGNRVAAVLGETPRAYTAFKNAQDIVINDKKIDNNPLSEQEKADIEANKQIKVYKAKAVADKEAGKYNSKNSSKDSSKSFVDWEEIAGGKNLGGYGATDASADSKRLKNKLPWIPQHVIDAELAKAIVDENFEDDPGIDEVESVLREIYPRK